MCTSTYPGSRLLPFTVVCIVLYLLPLVVVAQGGDDALPGAGVDLQIPPNNYTPPSPEAAALGQYGNTPVSLYTGKPNISLPLGQVQGREMAIDVSLSYNAGGVLVEEVATWAGLGWSLNAGGVITRAVNGQPDEGAFGGSTAYTSLYSSYDKVKKLYAGYGTDSGYQTGQYHEYRTVLERMANGQIETQPDYYFYNFNGYQGKIMIDPETGQAFTQPYSNLKITPGLTADTTSHWTIVTPNGATYRFRHQEITKTAQEAGTRSHISAWYLTEVTSPNGLDQFQFNYTQVNDVYVDANTNKQFRETYSLTDNPQVCGDYYKPQPVLQTDTWHTQQFLSSITCTSTGSQLVVGSTAQRKDHAQGRRLTGITCYAPNGRLKSSYALHHSYFGSTSTSHAYETTAVEHHTRLRLDSLTEWGLAGFGADSLQKPAHRFVYDPTPLPSRFSYGVDHWGYYNGLTNNTTYIPRVENYGGQVGLTLPGANRQPNFTYAKAGILTQVTYPTGGTTTYQYEPHTVPYYNPYSVPYLEQTQSAIVNGQEDTTTGIYCFTCNDDALQYAPAYDWAEFTLVKESDVRIELTGTVPGNPGMNGLLAMAFVWNTSNSLPLQPFQSNDGFLVKDRVNLTSTLPKVMNMRLNVGTYRVLVASSVANSTVNAIVTWLAPNNLSQKPLNSQVGGLRIKTITDYDGINPGNNVVRRFEYTTQNPESNTDSLATSVPDSIWSVQGGLLVKIPNPDAQLAAGLVDYYPSSGQLFSIPDYDYVHQQVIKTPQTTFGASASSPPGPETYSCFYLKRSATSPGPLGKVQGSHIGYQQVIEYRLDAQGQKTNGATVYNYTNQPVANSSSFPFAPASNNDDVNGLLVRQTVYDTAGLKVQRTENTYQFLNANDTVPGGNNFHQALGIKASVYQADYEYICAVNDTLPNGTVQETIHNIFPNDREAYKWQCGFVIKLGNDFVPYCIDETNKTHTTESRSDYTCVEFLGKRRAKVKVTSGQAGDDSVQVWVRGCLDYDPSKGPADWRINCNSKCDSIPEVYFAWAHKLVEPDDLRYNCTTAATYDKVSTAFYSLQSRWNYLQKTVSRTYAAGDTTQFLETTTEYFYDNPRHLQPTRTLVSNSRGEQYTTVTGYPADYAPGTDAVLDQMVARNMQGQVVEQQLWQHTGTDTLLLNGLATRYKLENNAVVPDTLLGFEQPQPLPLAQAGGFGIDSTRAVSLPAAYTFLRAYPRYYGSARPRHVYNRNGLHQTYVWCRDSLLLLAEVTGARPDNTAYSSFEAPDDKGGWAYNNNNITTHNAASSPTPGPQADNYAVTGHKVLQLTGTQQVKKLYPVLDGDFVLSYWYKNGTPTVNTSGTRHRTDSLAGQNGWQLHRHYLTLTSSDSLAVGGTVLLDEMRLYPQTAQMTTYAYHHALGITHVADANDNVSRYFYDALGRLTHVADFNGHIAQQYQYTYGTRQVALLPFTISNTAPFANATVNFDATAALGNSPGLAGAAQYQWHFGDGTTQAYSTSPTASHSYTQPGLYTVTLTVQHPTLTAPITIQGLVNVARQLSVSIDTTVFAHPATLDGNTATTTQCRATVAGGSGTYHYLWRIKNASLPGATYDTVPAQAVLNLGDSLCATEINLQVTDLSHTATADTTFTLTTANVIGSGMSLAGTTADTVRATINAPCGYDSVYWQITNTTANFVAFTDSASSSIVFPRTTCGKLQIACTLVGNGGRVTHLDSLTEANITQNTSYSINGVVTPITNGQTINLVENDSVTFNVNPVLDCGFTQYEWYLDDAATPNGTTATHTFAVPGGLQGVQLRLIGPGKQVIYNFFIEVENVDSNP